MGCQASVRRDGDFHEGRCAVKVGDVWGYIDKTGEIVVEPQYLNAYGYSEGLASVCFDDKWGFINEEGKMVIPPQFDNPAYFLNDVAFVEKDGKLGIIDRSGHVVCDFKYEPTELPYYSFHIPF